MASDVVTNSGLQALLLCAPLCPHPRHLQVRPFPAPSEWRHRALCRTLHGKRGVPLCTALPFSTHARTPHRHPQTTRPTHRRTLAPGLSFEASNPAVLTRSPCRVDAWFAFGAGGFLLGRGGGGIHVGPLAHRAHDPKPYTPVVTHRNSLASRSSRSSPAVSQPRYASVLDCCSFGLLERCGHHARLEVHGDESSLRCCCVTKLPGAREGAVSTGGGGAFLWNHGSCPTVARRATLRMQGALLACCVRALASLALC